MKITFKKLVKLLFIYFLIIYFFHGVPQESSHNREELFSLKQDMNAIRTVNVANNNVNLKYKNPTNLQEKHNYKTL